MTTPSKGAFTSWITLQVIQPRQIRVGRCNIAAGGRHRLSQSFYACGLCGVLRLVLIVILFCRETFRGEIDVALGGYACQFLICFTLLLVGERLFQCGLGLLQARFGLHDLLIQFRRLDFRQSLAGPHAIADIDETFRNVSVGAGKDGSFSDGLNIPGHLQVGITGRTLDGRDLDPG